jgi:MYXO-CTERM domain-containing protein
VQLSVTDSAGAVSRQSRRAAGGVRRRLPPPPPANNGGGGGGSSSPLWLTLLGLAALRARR